MKDEDIYRFFLGQLRVTIMVELIGFLVQLEMKVLIMHVLRETEREL